MPDLRDVKCLDDLTPVQQSVFHALINVSQGEFWATAVEIWNEAQWKGEGPSKSTVARLLPDFAVRGWVRWKKPTKGVDRGKVVWQLTAKGWKL